MLSKSRFVRGVNCQKSLWLYVNKREAQYIDDATMAVFAVGHEAGALAREYFPGGEMAVTGDYPGMDSANRTRELIAAGVKTIYEATFIYDNTLVAVDILNRENDGWHLYEMKSSNSLKPEHIKDVAVQYYVVQGCGIELSGASVMHMNREYVRRGKLDVKQLFVHESVLNDVLPVQEFVKTHIAELLRVQQRTEEPVAEMGMQCRRPYHCDFYEYCRGLLPAPAAGGPLSNIPGIDAGAIRGFIAQTKVPYYFLDFETIMPCVPMFDESRPYQQIPFQYSLHVLQSKDSEPVHSEYLGDAVSDPRPELIRSLVRNIKKPGSIFVYNIGFERSRLHELQRDFPEYAGSLEMIKNHLVDIMPVFRKGHYYTESMQGSYSMKAVLPALCPDLSYDALEIQEGGSASAAFMGLFHETCPETIRRTRQALLKYCKLDTYGLVKIMEKLMKVK